LRQFGGLSLNALLDFQKLTLLGGDLLFEPRQLLVQVCQGDLNG